MAAARALGGTRDPASVAALGTALDDKDPAMQYRAMAALKNVSGKDLGNDVRAWQQYVKGETPQSQAPTSIAERLRHMFW
jgi:HEAT repeat protein